MVVINQRVTESFLGLCILGFDFLGGRGGNYQPDEELSFGGSFNKSCRARKMSVRLVPKLHLTKWRSSMDPYDLKREIVAAYLASGNQLGWRLLYSPIDVLAEAEVAFLGMHPGGREISPDHAEFAMESGSAYVHESWAGSAPGESRLQKQVRQLFGHLGQEPAQVLAGNLVPFRSPDWNSLQNRKASLEFGVGLWRRIFHVTTPKLVIGSGTEIARPLADILGIGRLNEVNVG